MFTLVVKENDVSKRIDNFIAKCYPNLLKVLIYKFLRTKKIKVNLKKVTNDYRLQLNDEIEFFCNENELKNNSSVFAKKTVDCAFLNSSGVLNIIYENENFLVVNKPAGLNAHSMQTDDHFNLIDQIKKYLYQKKEYQPELENTFTPALNNRLDRNTEGLILASKNYCTLKLLNEAVASKSIRKFYYTYVYGQMEQKEGDLRCFIQKDETLNKAIVNDKKSAQNKVALLHYRSIIYYAKDNVSLIEVELLTGRFHQIRAQLAFVNHPLVGDGKYYNPKVHHFTKLNYKHQILVAYKLIFAKELSKKLLGLNDFMTFQISDVFQILRKEYQFQ